MIAVVTTARDTRGTYGYSFTRRRTRTRVGRRVMTWFVVDDSFHSHPKAMAAGPAALGLWVIAGSWSCANLTDGFVPGYVLPRLAEGAEELARMLVAAGLWRRARGGYRFHDWDHYQEARETRLKKREEWRTKKALQRAGKGKGDVNPKVNGLMSPGDTPGDSPPDSGGTLARPSPSPSPSVGSSLSSSVTGRTARGPDDDLINQQIIALLDDLTGRTMTPAWADRVRRQILGGRVVGHPARYVIKAIQERPKDFLPPPGPAEICPIHQLEQPCRGCRADQIAGGEP